MSRRFSLEPRPWALCAASPPCPAPAAPACRCLADFLAQHAEDDPQDTAHLLVLRESAEVVHSARPGIEQALRTLITAATATDSALRALATFVRQERILATRRQTARVQARYADDGPHDRRRQLRVPRFLSLSALAMAATLVVALFEVWFLGRLFRYLTGVGSSVASVEYWLSYLPGVGLALLLFWTGHLLAEPVVIWRRRRAGWTDAEPPWPEWRVPGALAVAVLALIGMAAKARGDFLTTAGRLSNELSQNGGASGGASGPYLTVVVVFLLVMLSVSPIVMKIAIHNPDADSANDAAAELAAAEDDYHRLRQEAENALAVQQDAWAGLRGLIWSTYSAVDDLWVMAGLRFSGLLPPSGQPLDPEPPDGKMSAGLLARTPRTPPAFGYVLHAAHNLGPYSPASAVDRLNKLVALADGQWQDRIIPSSDDPVTADWHRFARLDTLTTHWNRPGWTPGRRAYHWVLTFEGAAELHELATRCQDRLQLPGLDRVSPDELRLTLARLAFGDEIDDIGDINRAVAEARRSLAAIEPFTLIVGPATGSPDSIGLAVVPWEPLLALNDHLLDAGARTVKAMGEPDEFHPYINIAYVGETIDARPVVETVAALRELPRIRVVVHSVALVELRRESHAYEWDTVARLPLGAGENSDEDADWDDGPTAD
ncbi:2'-5' RNA ligase family protein [Frankia sp. CiP3]|uniref:2'-5' RNA ligase family protein n=1 Tax=Frankia sp. CiP3 TaxID=2880971 RepID=UPI001EF6905A|nr:2'-5' RNA ligase family protein [Frankia sp. CiP3]